MGFCAKGLKYEFETAVVNVASVFEPLKIYCICTKFFENICSGFKVIDRTISLLKLKGEIIL